MRFSGQVVVIAGAASGIGRACAEAFAAEDARLALLDLNAVALHQLTLELQARRVQCIPRTGDASDSSVTDAAIAATEEAFGRVDTLVSSVGIDLRARLQETSLEAWERLMRVNVWSAFALCRSAEAALRRSGKGSIVLVSSAAGLLPIAGRPAYNASKAALLALSRTLALDLAPAIRVNCICPGAVDTPLLRESLDQSDDPAVAMTGVVARYPLGRIAGPDEIARAVLFLASPEASFMTGAALAVDGGRTLH